MTNSQHLSNNQYFMAILEQNPAIISVRNRRNTNHTLTTPAKVRVVEPSSRSPRKFALRILVRVAAKIDESDVTLINFTQFRCEFLKSIQKLATCCATANITKNRTRWHVTPERFLAQHRITKNRRCKSTSATSPLDWRHSVK